MRLRLLRRGMLVAAMGVVTLTGCVAPVISAGPSVTVWMDASYGSGFFSMPWPNDLKRNTDGTLDLLGFPGADQSIELLGVTLLASQELTGFGTQTAVYVRLTGAIDPASLPSPTASLGADASVQLFDLDNPGDRVPVIVRVEPGDAYRPANTLSLLPYPGHTLHPATRYAAVVTDALRDGAGVPLAPAPLLASLDEAWWLGRARSEGDWNLLRGQRDAVRAALVAGGSSRQMVGFSVFRTADSTSEMRAITSTLDGLTIPAPNLEPGSCASPTGQLTRNGTIDLPDFQSGVYPFETAGGGIAIDGSGNAVVAGWRTYPVVVRVPCGQPPSSGWPIQAFVDGTGGAASLTNFIGLVDGAIAASVPPLFGVGTGVSNPASEALFYNTRNPEAARINPLQQAANHIALLKSLEQATFDGPTYASSVPVTTDPTREMISGQSQGAQTLPIVASMHPQVTTVVAGAGSAGFYNQVGYRTSSREELGAYTGAAALDIRNPWDQLVATVVDLAEPANYPNDADYLNFAGLIDGCVPIESSRHLAAAQHLTVVNSQWPSIFGDVSLDAPTAVAPISANSGGRTRVSLENPGGHFTAYDNLELARDFVTESLLSGVAPTVAAGPYGSDNGNCEPRYAPIGSGL